MNPPTIPPREWGFFSSHYNCAISCVYGSINKTMPMKYSHKQKREKSRRRPPHTPWKENISIDTYKRKSTLSEGIWSLVISTQRKEKMNHAKNESTFKVNICWWVLAHVIVTEQGRRTQCQSQEHSFPDHCQVPWETHLVFHTCLLRGWSFPLWDNLNAG